MQRSGPTLLYNMAWFCVSSRVYHLRPIILALGKITKAIIGLRRSPIVSFPACCVRVIATMMLIEESGIFNSFTVLGNASCKQTTKLRSPGVKVVLLGEKELDRFLKSNLPNFADI